MSRNVILSVCAVLLMASVAQANVLVDGAFEGLSPTGTQAIGSYIGGHTDGWYVRQGGAYLYWDFGGDRHQFQHLNNAIIQQVFPTLAGITYDVSFQAMGESPADQKNVNVWMDSGDVHLGAYDGDLANYNTGGLNNYGWTDQWDVYSFSFTATSSLTTITVLGTNRLGVDDFSVEPQITIPEPATMSLLAIGGLAALIRRKRS